MKIEVKKIDSNKREISIEVSQDAVKNKFDDIFKRIAKEAKVPGFRVGNVPRNILEKHYASYAREQALKELIPDIYNQAIEKEGLDVIELPNISDVKLDGNNLSFKAHVEVTPQITIKNYKGLKVSFQKLNVTDDEIKQGLKSLKESHKTDNINIDDNFAKSCGYPNLQELERALERQIYIQKENLQRRKIEDEIVEGIIKDLDFKLPQSLINRQLQELLRQAKLDMALRGTPKDKIEEDTKALTPQLEPQAHKQVKIYLVMAEIAKKENIPLDDHMPHRVMEFLLKEADWREVS